jgi:hypothetical protein
VYLGSGNTVEVGYNGVQEQGGEDLRACKGRLFG